MSPRSESHRHATAEQMEGAEPSPSAAGECESQTVVFPRRKAGQNKRPSTQAPVVVTLETLREVFDMPLWKACKALGICATAMKKVCRKLGVMEWPFKKNSFCRKAASSKAASQAPATPPACEADAALPSSTPPSAPTSQPPSQAGGRGEEAPPPPREIRTRARVARGSPPRARRARRESGASLPEGCEEGGGVVMVVESSGSETHETEAADECMSPEELLSLLYDDDVAYSAPFAPPEHPHHAIGRLPLLAPQRLGEGGGGLAEPSCGCGGEVWGDLDGAWLGVGEGGGDNCCLLVGDLDFLG